MLFRRLLENNARASLWQSAEGYAMSVVAHVAIIGGTVVVTTSGGARSEIAESFTPVAYFIPKDRIGGMRPTQERITYMSARPEGEGTEGVTTPTKPVVAAPTPEGPSSGAVEMPSVDAEASEESAADGDSVMTVLEVDSAAARYDDSAAPPYPPAMLERRIEGSVAIQYVVDTTGRADTGSVVILSATHPDFATSVRGTLPAMLFRPAVMGSRKVRQLVQQLFSFKIDTTLIAQQRAAAAAAAKKPEQR